MARKVKELKINKFIYLSKEFKENENFNEIDWSVAEYLFSLEATRQCKQRSGAEVLSYNYASIATICENTGIKAPQTVKKSIVKLGYFGIIKVNQEDQKKGKGISNRYIINNKWMKQIDPQNETFSEAKENNISDDKLSNIEMMMKEILQEVKELKKENQQLRNEISQLKQAKNENNIIYKQFEVDDTNTNVTKDVEYRTIDPIQTNESNNVFSEMAESLFSELKPKLKVVEDDHDEELGDEPVIEPIEETTITTKDPIIKQSQSFEEWEREMDNKYYMFSYIYDKPFSKLYSEKEILNEIDFRNKCNKPLFDLKERLQVIRSGSLN